MKVLTKSLKSIKAKTREFLIDRQKANNLIDVLSYFENASSNEADITATIRCCHKIFVSLLKEKQLNEESVEEYNVWLKERYHEVIRKLFELTREESVLIKLISVEAENPRSSQSKKVSLLPAVHIKALVHELLSEKTCQVDFIERFREYMEYDDVRYFVMKFASQRVETGQTGSELLQRNAFALLQFASMPTADETTKFLGRFKGDNTGKIGKLSEQKKLFSALVMNLLRMQLTSRMYKRILLQMHEVIMPHMANALALTDFLTDSYDIGGVISILALNGIFILVNNYNLEYPNFYRKLYSLIHSDVFYVKHRARFFFLLDLFLTSTHLPSYVVFSFVKRLSRLALVAPPSVQLFIIPLVFNLLRRHPSLQKLVHKTECTEPLSTDPFDNEEEDLSATNAQDSSLWEIKSLTSHYYSLVSDDAERVGKALSDVENDISAKLETTEDDLFENEIQRKYNTVEVNFEEPTDLFPVESSNSKLKLWKM